MDTQSDSSPLPSAPTAPQHNTAMGILSYLGVLVIIPLLMAKDDPFVKFHAKQGLVLLIIDILVWFVLGSFLWQLWMIGQLLNLGILVLVIIGIINVVKGRQQELPLVGQLAHYLTF